jgi:pyruvate dehydrogenase E2 component (dihydrolipoamide acetyltransferase)
MPDLVMPQLGLTMTEGKILQWFKQPGEPFQVGEPLFEVETDKVNLEVEAADQGTLIEIVTPVNELLPVSTVIARYRTATDTAPETEVPRKVLASPRARKAAAAHSVDLESVNGSGPKGRIVEQDVLLAANAAARSAPSPATPTTPAASPPAAPVSISHSRMQGVIADRMTQSFQTAPHFYLTREIDAAELVALKRTLSAALERRGSSGISVTDMLIRAMAMAMAAHPGVNASWRDGRIVPNMEIAIGLAIALDDGLIVPVLRDLAAIDLMTIAKRRRELVNRSRSGRLSAADFSPAGATLSNLGMFGVDQFQAILNPPESVILATGRIRDRVVAVNGLSAVRPTMSCTVSVDHRVLDGAQAARFMAAIAEALEAPALLLLP